MEQGIFYSSTLIYAVPVLFSSLPLLIHHGKLAVLAAADIYFPGGIIAENLCITHTIWKAGHLKNTHPDK